ncbi:MAG: hypothetical protein ACK56F_23720, partial [bacterium]
HRRAQSQARTAAGGLVQALGDPQRSPGPRVPVHHGQCPRPSMRRSAPPDHQRRLLGIGHGVGHRRPTERGHRGHLPALGGRFQLRRTRGGSQAGLGLSVIENAGR